MKRKSYRRACDHDLLNYKVLMRKMEEFLGMLLVSCCMNMCVHHLLCPYILISIVSLAISVTVCHYLLLHLNHKMRQKVLKRFTRNLSPSSQLQLTGCRRSHLHCRGCGQMENTSCLSRTMKRRRTDRSILRTTFTG